MKTPHPIPYQGSKRKIALRILRFFPPGTTRLVEPFAGSAAITLAAASNKLAREYWLNDLNQPLARLWEMIVHQPEKLSARYECIWRKQHEDPRGYYDKVRRRFNNVASPECLLYLLARCVKASVRYNADGQFNQSPDNRRRGARPETMRKMIFGARHLLSGKTRISSLDYREVLASASRADLIYMDPPYQGVCRNRDSRYLASVNYDEFAEALENLNQRQIRYIVSYDGRTGTKAHGKPLPAALKLKHVEIHAGRSSQATLLGRNDFTVESLYLSPALAEEFADNAPRPLRDRLKQNNFIGMPA